MSKYSSSVNNLLHIRQSGNDKYVAIGKDRNSSITNLDDVNIQAQFRVLNNIWTPSINLNNIESTYNSNVINIGSGNTIIQLNPHVGIGTNDPSVSFEINTVDSMKIPKGNTSQRPANLTSTDKGFIRYNAELDQFEGFGAGDQWRSLEGVIDTDQDTYITAHNNPFDDNDELQFYTAGTERMIIKDDGKVGIGTDTPNVSLDISYKTDAIKLPKGDNSARDAIGASSIEDQGLIRYNTELNQFEGYGAGNAWGSLGGVIDIDQDTYIIAESNTTDNDELQFYTAGDQRMIIKDDGKIGIGTSTPSVLLDIYDCNEHILKVGYDNIEISRSIIPSNSNVDIGDPENQIRDMYVSDNSLWIGDTHKISHSDGKLKFRKRKTANIPQVILDLPAYSGSSEAQILQAISTFFNDDSLLTVSNITLKHWLGFYREQKGADRTISIQEIFRDDADDYEEETAADAWLVTRTNDIYLGNDYGKIGIGTDNPNVSLDISYRTDAIKLPKGNTTTRNAIGANATEDQGLIRYNTELKQFEGYGAGNAWGSLGGVMDVDQDTYIKAEANAGDDNDELEFYTAGDERMIIKSDGKIGLNVSDPSHQVHIKGNTRIEGDLIVNGTQRIIDTDTSTTEQVIVTNDGTGPALIVNQIGAQPIIDIQDDSNSILFIEDGGNIGIKTTNPSVSFEINTTDSIKIPKGNTNERPANLTSTDKGLIRYNTQLNQFEGFGAGDTWGSLGGVMDVDQDTYIKAETNAGDDNDELQFYTDGAEQMIIKNDGKVGVGTSTPDEKLHINGNIKVIGNIVCDSLDTRFADLQEVLTITPGSITNDQLATLVQPDLVSAKAINIDSTATGGLDNSTDDLKIKAQGVNNNHILNGTIDLTQKVVNNLPVANGGTGANTANDARTNLGLAIGTNVQAYSAKLQSIANLAASAAKIPMFSGLTSTSLLDFVDDEDMLGNSATAVPSQRSVKKYVDTLVGFLNIVIYTLHASNLDSNVEPLAPEAEATLTLDADYSIVGAEGTEQYDTFIVDMTADLANTLGVDESIIEITEVSEGSLVVDFVLKPSEIDSNFNPSQAVVALKETLEDSNIAPNSNSKFLSQATVAVPPEVVAQALDPSKIFVTLENDRAKIINIAKYFKGEFITYELITNPHDNVLIDSALQQITITGAFRDSIYDIVINANKGPVSKDLIFNVTEPAPFPPTAKDPKKLVLSDNKKQVNLLDKFKGSYLEIFEIDQNPFNNVSLVDSSNMIYEVQGAFRDTSYSIVFKATQNGGDNLSAYWTLNIKELPLIPTKLLPDIDNLLVATGQTITYNLKFVFIGNGLEYGFRTNPYPDNIYITNNVLYITENQRGITYPIEVFGKNLAQTLIWKITLTEDLPPAPTVIGVDSSNFITTDIINYDLTTIFSGINVSYDIEYYYNIGGSTYPPIDSFFIQNKPWARYHSKNWNKYLNRIVDTSGYNRESIELLSGNISIGSNYISGDKDASMKIPMPNTLNWTVCFAVKYNGANKGTIISGEQTILGHWNGYRGFVQLGGQLLTKIESIGNADDWLILCIKTNGTAPNNIRLNGTSIGAQTNEVALDYLYINKDLNSDWIFGDFMVWDYEFNTSQTLSVSDLFLDHIAGTTNALKNDIQPVELKSIYNNYNFESNIVSISGNNRGTKYDIYVVGLNTRDSVKWKLEIGEGIGTRSENISLTKGVHEYNIKHLFNSTDYKPHLTVNNENFYNITDNVLTFYPNYRDLEYGLIINSANEQYIFNIKEETGVAPRSFSDNNFHLIDNRVIENVDVIGANATVDNTIVIESTTVLYFPENMVSSLLLIDNNKYYYINNIVLNGIYQIKCDSNDIKVLDNTLNVKYSSLSNGIAIDNTVVNNLLTDIFSVTDASSNPKFVLKYTPYEKITILNNFVNLVSTLDVNPEFDSGSGSVISGSTYSYSSDNNFTANFTEQFDNCELLLIDNNKYYYNSNVSLDGNKQFILSSSNVELVGSTFNSGTDGEVIDLTNLNALITNVFGSDQTISNGGSTNVSIPLTQEPVVNPVIDLTNVVAWYKFNDSTNIGLDSSGNSYDITVTNEVASSFTELGFDNNPTVMQFDTGTYAEYVSSSSANNLIKHQNNKPYCSISFWAKNLSATTSHQVLWISQINGTDFKMYISPNSNKLQLIYYTGNWGNSKYTESAEIPTLFSANWKHFVIVSNGSNGIIKIRDETENSYTQYLNLDISGLGNMGVGNETFTLSLGANVASGSVIDDFRIYDKVLSDTEINGIYGEKSLAVLTSHTDYKILTFNGNNTKIFSFREDESPFSWQEAYDEAIANGNRMPTKTELLDYLASQGNQPLYNENVWIFVSDNNAINKDAIQIGNTSTNPLGQSHYDSFATETFFTERTRTFQRYYCEVIEKTEYTVNFPMDTKCDILLVGDNKYALESGVTLNGDYTFELGSTSKIIKTADISYTTELLSISGYGSWDTHNQTAINAGGRLPTRAEIIALLNGDTTNNHLLNPNINQTNKDVWIPVSDYTGAFIEIGDYPDHGYYTLKTPSGTETYYENNVLTTAGTSTASNTIWGDNSAWVPNTNIYYTKDNTTPVYTSGTTDLNTVTELLPISTFGSWNTHNQTAINAGGRLPTRAEIIALLNGDTTNNHLINPDLDQNTKDVWIPVSDYVGAIIEIGDYPHTPPFYKMSTPNGGETYSEGTTGAYSPNYTIDTILNEDIQWAPKTNIYYTKTAISSDISGTATDYDSSGIVLKYYMVSGGGSTETPGTIDTTNMLVWYKFDDATNIGLDSSGNSNDGTNAGSSVSTSEYKRGTGSLALTNTSYQLPSIQFATETTISFWLYGDWSSTEASTADHNKILNFFNFNSSNVVDYRLSLQKYTADNKFHIKLKAGSLGSVTILSNTTIDNNTWYFVTLIFNTTNGNIKVYINNSLIKEETHNNFITSDTPYTANNISGNNTNEHLFYGYIDDFRIYNKALTAQEISDIYNDTEPLVGGSSSSTETSSPSTIVKTEERAYPPTGKRDFVPTSGSDLSYTKNINSVYGSGDYIVSVSSYDPTYPQYNPIECFNEGDDVAGIWLIGNYTDMVYSGTFNNNSGKLSSLGYEGDWIQIKLPVKIQLTKTKIKQRSAFLPERSPGDFKIFGSNDETTWIELVSKTLVLSDYVSFNYETTDILDNTNTYQYFILIVNKTLSTSSVMNFDEWYIYGKEHSVVNTTNLKLWFLFNDDLVEKISNTTYTLTQGTPNYIAGKFDKALNITDDSKLNILNHTDIIVEGQTTVSFSFWLNNLDQNVRDQTLLRYRPTNILLRYSSQYETIGTFVIILEGGSMTKVIGNITSWTHFGFIFNGDTWNIYINGIDDTSNWTNNSSTTTLDDGFTNDNNTFGLFYNDANGGMDYFRSSIDDFRIYDKALTVQEISNIYNDTEPLVGGSSSSTTGTIDTTNMLVWYKFDDATNIGLDSSGNSNDGTNAGSSVSTSEYKRGTGSLALTNTSYQLPSIQFATETTISFWFQWDLTQTTEDYNKLIDLKTDTNGRFMLYRELNNNYLRFFVSDENNVSSNIELNTVNFSDNIWYLIIITINVVSGEINININNNNIHTGNYLNKVSNSFVYTNNYIGSKFDNTAGYFYGYIDDFRIYNKALTAQEISNIYNDTEPLVGGSSSSTETTTNYTPIQRVFLKYTTIVKTIEPSIVDTIYLHPVNTTPILIANDEYYVEIKSTNIIYLPKTYANAEILIIGSTKYVKYENVSLNEFATITINNDLTTISVNNNNYDLANGITIDTALTTELNTYNITEHNNIPKVLIKYTTSATTKVTNIVFKDQEYVNVLDYATSLQITNNNITYDENNLKISSNVVKDFDNYFTETIQATNEYGTSSLDYNFIKLGYNGVVVPNLENVSKDIYILNTIANIDLREIANGDNYKLVFNPYEFQNNTILIGNILTLTTNERGIYDILVSIDNKLYVLRIHETERNMDDDLYTIG